MMCLMAGIGAKSKTIGAHPGIEPGITYTRSKYHTTRPMSPIIFHYWFENYFIIITIQMSCIKINTIDRNWIKKGPTENRTQIIRVKVWCDNHYTMEPSNGCRQHCYYNVNLSLNLVEFRAMCWFLQLSDFDDLKHDLLVHVNGLYCDVRRK